MTPEQMIKAGELLERVRKMGAENEALKAQLAAIREPLTDYEIKDAIAELYIHDVLPMAVEQDRDTANAIHRAILARIDSNE